MIIFDLGESAGRPSKNIFTLHILRQTKMYCQMYCNMGRWPKLPNKLLSLSLSQTKIDPKRTKAIMLHSK